MDFLWVEITGGPLSQQSLSETETAELFSLCCTMFLCSLYLFTVMLIDSVCAPFHTNEMPKSTKGTQS